jgi:hypothetical protein
MAFIQSDTDKAYREQMKDADRKWEKEVRETEAIRQKQEDNELVEQVEERYRRDNNGKSPP